MKKYIFLLGLFIQFIKCDDINSSVMENIVIYFDSNLLVELFYYNGHQLCFSFDGDIRLSVVDKNKVCRKNYLLQVGCCYNYDISWWIGNIQLTNVFLNVAWVKLLNNQNQVDITKYVDFSIFIGFFTYWFIFGFYFVNWSKYQKDFGIKFNFRICNFKIFNFAAGGVIAYKKDYKNSISKKYTNKSSEDIEISFNNFEENRNNPFFTMKEHEKASEEINRCIGYCDSLTFLTILDEESQVIKDYYEKYETFEERRNNLDRYFSGYANDLLMLMFYYKDYNYKSQEFQIKEQKKKINDNIKEFNYTLDGKFPIIEVIKHRFWYDEYTISEYQDKLDSFKNDYSVYKYENSKNSDNIETLITLIKILSEPKKIDISKLNDKYNMELVNIFEKMEFLGDKDIDDILKYLIYDYEQNLKKEVKKQDLDEDDDLIEDNDVSKKTKDEINKEIKKDKQKLLEYLQQALLEEQNIKEKLEKMRKECELWEFIIDSHIAIFKNFQNSFDEEVFQQLQEDNYKVIERYEKELEKEKKKKQKTNIFDVI